MSWYTSACREAERLRGQETVRILALETSCDETAAAVVENGRGIRSDVIFSQIDLHALYGGVVPEIASRAHLEAVPRVLSQALKEAEMTLEEIDALAVTAGPGLVGALLTGVNAMKGLAFAAGKPLIAVNHIEGHVSANYLTSPELTPPFLCLVVSGGHSHLVEVEDYGVYRLLGQTRDDAAGEAFDKAARALGLPYPGGPRLDALAEQGNPEAYTLPRPKTEGKYDYSFSGLKTAFLNLAHTLGQRQPLTGAQKADLAACFRAAVVRELLEKAELLLRDRRAEGRTLPFALAGGVSANSLLRKEAAALCERMQLKLYLPRLRLCTDNAAMIGSAAYYRFLREAPADLTLNAMPAWRIV